MGRGGACCAIALVILALVSATAASAAPPANVQITLSGNRITANWDPPALDGSNVPSAVEIAHSPNMTTDGSFSDSSKLKAPLGLADTTYTSPPLPNGTYYVH